LRIIFMGSPGFAVPTLDVLVDAGHDVIAVYCQPPRAAGRGKALQPTPVHKRADEIGIPVRHPVSLRDEAEQDAFGALDADAAVVAAYGLILPRPVLDAPRLGCINVHASLLPRWRGAAPVQRAILAGDATTGVTIMQMEAGLDTGPMLTRREVAVDRKTAGELTDELAEMGAALMVGYLRQPSAHPPVPQPEDGVTYAAKISKAEARIDWSQPADAIERQVRAFAPTPGAWFAVGEERIRLLAADVAGGSARPGEVINDRLTIGCGAGAIRPLLVQRAGRAPMSPADLLRGFPVACGSILA
jgi:methionyl-tRNA formyltransferase